MTTVLRSLSIALADKQNLTPSTFPHKELRARSDAIRYTLDHVCVVMASNGLVTVRVPKGNLVFSPSLDITQTSLEVMARVEILDITGQEPSVVWHGERVRLYGKINVSQRENDEHQCVSLVLPTIHNSTETSHFHALVSMPTPSWKYGAATMPLDMFTRSLL